MANSSLTTHSSNTSNTQIQCSYCHARRNNKLEPYYSFLTMVYYLTPAHS